MKADWLLLISGIILLGVSIYQIIRIRNLESELSSTLSLLGYYRVRFGMVKREDVENLVGITEEKMEAFIKEISSGESNKKK